MYTFFRLSSWGTSGRKYVAFSIFTVLMTLKVNFIVIVEMEFLGGVHAH